MKKLTFSPQSQNIYRLLLHSGAMKAADIGKSLKIFPQAVYRSINNLIEAGCVEQFGRYPITFQAILPEETVSIFLAKERAWFLEAFQARQSGRLRNKDSLDKPTLVRFIQTRKESYNSFTKDAELAKHSISLLVSGFEMPTEQILAFKRAIDRKVKIQIIVQNFETDNREMFANWQRMGIEVRSTPLVKTRLMIIDTQIVYLLSYNSRNSESALGVRFDYSPVAELLNGVFREQWHKSHSI